MASSTELNGSLPFPKPSGPSSVILGQGAQTQPGSFIPRGGSIEPNHERNRETFTPSASSQQFDQVTPRSGNNSPVAGFSGPNGGKPQTVFIHKLYDMLEDASLSHLIWWSRSQDSFCLYPGEEFSNVLAQYFKHTNIASFIRQLNMYGFHKVNDNFQPEDKHHNCSQVGHCEGINQQPSASQQTRWEFRHTANHFRKGDLESLNLIKRKSSKVMSSHKEIVSLKTIPPTSDVPQEELKQMRESPTSEQYHRNVYQQSWNQIGVPVARTVSASSTNDHPRQQSGAFTGHTGPPAPMGQYPYPVYAQQVGIPHSPGSPSFQELSPSYFLHSPSHPQAQSQPSSRHASVQTPAISLDASVNFRLIELSTTVKGLKAAYSDLLARHDSLAAMYQKGQADLLHLTEIVDKLSKRPDSTQGDRPIARTPVNSAMSPSQDRMSPLTARPPSTATFASFKNQLQSNLQNAAEFEKSQSPKQQYKSSETTSISTVSGSGSGSATATATATGMRTATSSSSSSSSSAVSGVVPQQYPSNPNYTLYNTPENTRRPTLPHETSGRPPFMRQVSVLVDPLQPAPQNMPQRGGIHGLIPPQEVAGLEQTQLKDDKQVPTYVQQYQPFAHAHAYYQQIVHDQNQLRTSSLPAMSHPLPQRLVTGSPQRHSLNALVHYNNEGEEEKVMNTSRPSTAMNEPLIHVKPEESPRPPSRKQLPSMEELNKSLRTVPTSGTILNIHPSNESDEESVKRRKIEE